MSLTAIILAAGKATRMKTRRPKALLEVCGKPMLHYILRACYGAGVERILLVVGHGKDEVMAAFSHDKRITFVEQTEQRTGLACRFSPPTSARSWIPASRSRRSGSSRNRSRTWYATPTPPAWTWRSAWTTASCG